MLLVALVFVAVPLLSTVRCEEPDNWVTYLEYWDTARKISFTCYYDRTGVAGSGDSPIIRVWEKRVPQGACFGKGGRAEGRELDETTNLFELDCSGKKTRVIETYSEYEGDVVTYSLEPSPWEAPLVGSREDQLLRIACRSAEDGLAAGDTERPANHLNRNR